MAAKKGPKARAQTFRVNLYDVLADRMLRAADRAVRRHEKYAAKPLPPVIATSLSEKFADEAMRELCEVIIMDGDDDAQ